MFASFYTKQIGILFSNRNMFTLHSNLAKQGNIIPNNSIIKSYPAQYISHLILFPSFAWEKIHQINNVHDLQQSTFSCAAILGLNYEINAQHNNSDLAISSKATMYDILSMINAIDRIQNMQQPLQVYYVPNHVSSSG